MVLKCVLCLVVVHGAVHEADVGAGHAVQCVECSGGGVLCCMIVLVSCACVHDLFLVLCFS